MKYRITNQRELRREFWETFPELDRRKLVFGGGGVGSYQAHRTDTRVTFVDWIDALQKSGDISEALAQRATL